MNLPTFINSLACAALALSAPTAAMAKDPVSLFPIGPWEFQKTDNSCAVGRGFAGKDEGGQVQLRQYGPGDDFYLYFVVDGIDTDQPSQTHRVVPQYQFEPDDEFQEINSGRMSFENSGSGYFGLATLKRGGREITKIADGVTSSEDEAEGVQDWDPVERAAREAEIRSLFVKEGFTSPIRFHVGPMSMPMDQLRECMDQVVAGWGVDPEAYKSERTHVRPRENARWARAIQQEYPAKALQIGIGAFVPFRLMVDEKGKPTDCTVSAETTDSAFNKVACRLLMANAEFFPAIDSDGNPVASFYTGGIRYIIP